MDTVETVKAKIEAKAKELESLKKKIPYKCGESVHNMPLELAIQIEELEIEIERLKEGIKEE